MPQITVPTVCFLSFQSTDLLLPLSLFVELLLPLGLLLPLHLAHKLWRAILNEIAHVVDTSPLGQAIRNVHDTLTIEHVASVSN